MHPSFCCVIFNVKQERLLLVIGRTPFVSYLDQPVSRVLESFTTPVLLLFCGMFYSVHSGQIPYTAVLVPSNSQPPGSSTMNTGLAVTSEPAPSWKESTSVSPQASDPLELPLYQPFLFMITQHDHYNLHIACQMSLHTVSHPKEWPS